MVQAESRLLAAYGDVARMQVAYDEAKWRGNVVDDRLISATAHAPDIGT